MGLHDLARFHSAVLLVDCWKTSYRQEGEGEEVELRAKAVS